MGWASYEEDNASRFHQATVIRNKEHDALLPAKEVPATKLKAFAMPQPRPLPVIVLADVSGSMSEDGKIDILNNALKSMILSFGAESKLRAEIQVGLITFGGEVAKEHLPLVAADRIAGVEAFRAQGRTPMGSAFEMARQLLEDKEKIPARAYRPVLVLVSDGAPTDDWKEPLAALKGSDRAQKASRFALAIGADADRAMLGQFVNDRENPVFEADGVFVGFSSEQDADQDLVVRAVQAVVGELGDRSLIEWPSPVMPGKLKEQAELIELEKRLAKDMPHLFNIEQSPRMSMRYDAELTPTSRARRLASGALVRLASHSDDWNRRDFKGVSPKRLLAEVSEDELHIYENVVYARLLDRLYIHLNQRVRSLRTLQARRNDAAAIANAEELDHRLRYRLCGLWGTAYSTDAESKNAGSDVLSELSTRMKKIMRLRLGRLYQAIPNSSRVPQVLRTTNVLLHDQNYKRLRPLWSMAHAVVSDQARTAKMRIEAAEGRYQQFRRYVSLLIQHALSSSKLLKPGKQPDEYRFGQRSLILAESARGEFLLSLKSSAFEVERPLIFAPVWRGQGQWSLDGSERQVVFCHAPPSATEEVFQWGTGEDAVLNPLQFYSVERVKARIEAWLISRLASAYPMLVSPWPQASSQELCAAFPDTFSAEGRGLRVLKPVADQDQARLRSIIQASGASESGISNMWWHSRPLS